jgi:hypothetical protein
MTSKRRTRIKPLPPEATDAEVGRFLDSHDPEELERQGIMVRDNDRDDLEVMLKKYLSEPNNDQLNIRLPRSAKRMLARLASQKTIDASTLARIWIVERLRRETRA